MHLEEVHRERNVNFHLSNFPNCSRLSQRDHRSPAISIRAARDGLTAEMAT